ncbi:MAG: hypothetical protein ACOX6N_02595 [Patescibacteria group bacterium]|jgi:hypothetical protein
MSNKLYLPIIYLAIFVITGAISKGHMLRLDQMGQFVGLGGVVVGYFVGKRMKK